MGSVTVRGVFFAFVAVVLVVVVAFSVRGIGRDTPPEEIETSSGVAPMTTAPCDSFLMTATLAEPPATVASGQTLYVPVYFQIQHVGGRRDRLTANLSVRNTDLSHSITVTTVNLCDTDGGLLQSYVDSPQELGPLALAEYATDSRHTASSSGASFIVEWMAGDEVTEPVVEAVMAMTSMRGLAFVSRGVVIGERRED